MAINKDPPMSIKTDPVLAMSHTMLTDKEVNGVIDHADRSVTRAKLEYPTVDVPLVYLFCIGKAGWSGSDFVGGIFTTVDPFDNRRIEVQAQVAAVYGDPRGVLVVRYIDGNNFYIAYLYAPSAGYDHYVQKRVGGATTGLASEAVDLTAEAFFEWTFSANGSTLKVWRQNVRNLSATPTFTITDTSIASGRWGGRYEAVLGVLRAPASPKQNAITFFEVPVIGSGTEEDPFRAKMPELIKDTQFGKTNVLALTHSALIKTNKHGKPVDYRAIVRIFNQPDRQAHLKPIADCLAELRTMVGVKELTREEAIREAKKLDDLLTDKDLSEW